MDGTAVLPALLDVAERKGTLRADFQPFTPSPVRLCHTLERDGWDAAEKVLEAARADDPGAASAQHRLADALEAAGDRQRKWFCFKGMLRAVICLLH